MDSEIIQASGYVWNGRFFKTRIEAMEFRMRETLTDAWEKLPVRDTADSRIPMLAPMLEELCGDLCKEKGIVPDTSTGIEFFSEIANNDLVCFQGLCIMLFSYFRSCKETVVIGQPMDGFPAGLILYSITEPALVYTMCREINLLKAKLDLAGETCVW